MYGMTAVYDSILSPMGRLLISLAEIPPAMIIRR
jgi:hypothetical protein